MLFDVKERRCLGCPRRGARRSAVTPRGEAHEVRGSIADPPVVGGHPGRRRGSRPVCAVVAKCGERSNLQRTDVRGRFLRGRGAEFTGTVGTLSTGGPCDYDSFDVSIDWGDGTSPSDSVLEPSLRRGLLPGRADCSLG